MRADGAFPYHAPEMLRARFVAGLERQLRDEGGLGPFILVLNNALMDQDIATALGDAPRRRFGALSAAYQERRAAGRDADEPADDLAVFEALLALGFGAVAPVRERAVGPWRLQYNQVRALRPARSAAESPRGNRAPFDPARFHFDKPFLRKETFWSGAVGGVALDLLYNKFPFAPYHGLLVPERGAHRPQWLGPGDHRLAWRLAEGAAVDGFGIGYNAYGAFASINHLHFQTFADPRPLPVEQGRWRHNGGGEPYPAACEVFTDANAAWRRLDALQAAGTSFNLLYRPGRLYCLSRRRQGDLPLPEWCGGLAWLELCGAFVVSDPGRLEGMAAAELEGVLWESRP